MTVAMTAPTGPTNCNKLPPVNPHLPSLAALLATAAFACAGCVPPAQSNGAKMGEALAFAAAAGVAQVAESVAEQNARNNAPVTHATYNVSPQCDDQGQYACVTVTPPSGASSAAPAPDMTDADARDYVLGYVNGIRKLNGAPRVERDADLDAFAQAGSEQLVIDHRTGAHWSEHAPELKARSAEVQASPTASPLARSRTSSRASCWG